MPDHGNSSRRTMATVAVTLAAGLLLAACGTLSGTSGTTSGQTSVSTSAAAGASSSGGTSTGTSDGTTGGTTGGTSGGSSVATKAAVTITDVSGKEDYTFATPSRNIYCSFNGDGSMRCDVQKYTFALPPKPANCDVDWGAVGLLDTRGTMGSCIGDTEVDPKAPTLAYGHGLKSGHLECVSSTAALTCRNTVTGGLLQMSRASYKVR